MLTVPPFHILSLLAFSVALNPNYPIALPHIAVPFGFEGEVNTGDSVQLNCYVSKGDTPLAITWMLNGKVIQPHSGISTISIGDRTSLLTIASVVPEHAGFFSCIASNRAGQASRNATLFINGTSVDSCSFLSLACQVDFQFFPSTTPNSTLRIW